jgi:hypothetical protein
MATASGTTTAGRSLAESPLSPPPHAASANAPASVAATSLPDRLRRILIDRILAERSSSRAAFKAGCVNVSKSRATGRRRPNNRVRPGLAASAGSFMAADSECVGWGSADRDGDGGNHCGPQRQRATSVDDSTRCHGGVARDGSAVDDWANRRRFSVELRNRWRPAQIRRRSGGRRSGPDVVTPMPGSEMRALLRGRRERPGHRAVSSVTTPSWARYPLTGLLNWSHLISTPTRSGRRHSVPVERSGLPSTQGIRASTNLRLGQRHRCFDHACRSA